MKNNLLKMDEKVKKAKLIYRILLIAVFLFAFGLIVYQAITEDSTIKEQIFSLLMFILAIVWLISNFYKDRFNRYLEQKEIIDFWLFYITSLTKIADMKEILRFFILFPKLIKQSDSRIEKVRIRMNIFIFSFYAIMIILFTAIPIM